jgi:hypothetical protein
MISKLQRRSFWRNSRAALLLFSMSLPGLVLAGAKPGFVVHFDFLSDVQEARDLVRIAVKTGAQAINVVPPAHIWENNKALEMFDAILDEISRNKLSFVITRIDAAFPPAKKGDERYDFLYVEILTQPGILPSGRKTTEYFLTTVGRKGYAEWMEEEIRYYAEHYGRSPGLLGINLGPFSEPFAAERCGFLQYQKETQRYEITQYTPEAKRWYHQWLSRHYRDIQGVNKEYGASFANLKDVPLPLNENDSRFGKPDLAYFDFARSLNDWLVERYVRCRRIWHEASGRRDVPLILQLCGSFPEKLAKGRPAFAAFNMPGWVAMADAIGLSLYTNSGFPDFGHASVRAAVNLAALACDLHKDVFVLEGGAEAPNVILDPGELAFFGSAAQSLNPRTYIYEFLKEKFDEPYKSNPGKLVMANGEIRKPAFEALQSLFREMSASKPSFKPPDIYFVFDKLAARGNSQAGRLNAALYDIASEARVRWIPAGSEGIMRPGIPVLRQDGSVVPTDAKLSQLFCNIPEVGSLKRAEWFKTVVEIIHK